MNKDMGKFSELFDMHSHFLPGIDDGCQTLEETLAILNACIAQNVCCICATPHYDPNTGLLPFLRKRQQSYEYLQYYLNDDSPYIIPGAEIAFYDGLVHEEHLDSLCLGGSRYLLVEMPFDRWTAHNLRDIDIIQNSYGFRVIIAHLERYIKYQSKTDINELLSLGVLVQMNAGYLINKETQKKALRMINKGYVDFLGSDCHDPVKRSENIGYAYNFLREIGMENKAKKILYNSRKVCELALEL